MRYFAMIDGNRQGPYTLAELADAGVTPDTYVWCKGMETWQKADEVADICRYFRRTIFEIMHPSAPAANSPAKPNPQAQQFTRFFGIPVEYSGETNPEADESAPLMRPAPTIFLSLMLMLFCFPVTGAVAFYYSLKARKYWQEALQSESKHQGKLYDREERKRLRIKLAESDRQARMWVGITFFLGFIMIAFVGSRFF
ncbi:MAG: GYF domain-containing protein [Muribaculaceae bacterium]|nr:GYF domain-containing protein [Muribaculaceae bacterium]